MILNQINIGGVFIDYHYGYPAHTMLLQLKVNSFILNPHQQIITLVNTSTEHCTKWARVAKILV